MILILGIILGVPAAAIAYRFFTSRPSYLVDQAKEALARGDLDQAERVISRLQRRGHDSAAHLIRGKVFVGRARSAVESAPRPIPYEGVQQASQIVLGGAGSRCFPPALQSTAWLSGTLVQQSFPREFPDADDLREALKEFVQILDDDPWAAEATVLASECLIRLGERRPAALVLTSLLKRQPDNVDAHRWLAAIYIDLNCPGPAIDELKEWTRLDSTNPRPYRWLGFFARESDRASEAVDAYHRALQLGLEPLDRVAVLEELAEMLVNSQGDYQTALKTLEMGSTAFQNRPSVLALRAECLVGLGKTNEAVRILDAVLKQHPTFKAALLVRARVCLQEDQPRAAIPLLEKVIRLHPNDPVGRQSLMLAYRATKDDSRAAGQKRYLDTLSSKQERVLKLQAESARDPWNARARHQLALSYATFSRPQALAWIHAAFASNPDDQTIRKTWTQMIGYQPPALMRPSPSSSTERR